MRTLRMGTAEQAGMSSSGVDHIGDLCANWTNNGIHPALVVLVTRHGVIALHEAFGSLGPQPDDPPLTKDAVMSAVH